MKKQAFVARSPLELDDRVVCTTPGGDCGVHTVTDILAVHSARTGTVTFQYVLDWNVVVLGKAILYRLDANGRPVALTSEQVASTGPARYLLRKMSQVPTNVRLFFLC